MAYYKTDFVSDGIAFVSINFLNIGVLLWELAYIIIAYVFNYADLHFRNNRILSGISLAILIVFIASHLIVLDFSNKYDDDIYDLYLENGKKTDITKVIDYESDKKIKPAEFFNENFRDKLGNYKICIGKSYEYEDDQGNRKFDYESKFTDNIYSEEIVFEPYLRDFTISLYSKYTMQHLFSVNVRILHEEDKIDDDIKIIINSEKINNLLKI